MKEPLGRFSSIGYALMRFVAGALFTCHGTQKLLGVPGGRGGSPHGLMLAAGIIEIVGGPLIAVGLFTRLAAFIASGEMAVAYFKAGAPKSFWPIVNKAELAVIFCFVFLFIATVGGGRFSLDDRFRRRTKGF